MAGLHAFHTQPVPQGSGEITLDANESAHLVKSLRAREGEPIQVFNGAGRVWNGAVADANARALVMRVESEIIHKQIIPSLVLAQTLPKGSMMDDIVRGAVEMGVAVIQPLFSERCEVRLDADRAEGKLERWRSIAVEACKQSGNPFLPEIHPPMSLKSWVAKPMENTFRMVGSLEPEMPRLSDLKIEDARIGELLMLIGPEGDFSPDEYTLIREQGFQGVRFGANILRVHTAALYALASMDQFRQRVFPS
ncbi:MAG: 16S rRNA (uracil(1498)-N(3))-methyltransferase [Puniceicoccales bacterium]|jgi:16S rRNA (uracil1498-N3)-methyltransferase|nr:16S rRNA (uracil(1498)-N(3))-methyltransferase [Puniceicoccales bacterium]